MKTQAMFLVTVLLLAAGCTSSKPEFYWYKPDRTLKEVKADYSECDQQAQEEAAKMVQDEYFDGLRSPTAIGTDTDPSAGKKKPADPAPKAKADWGELYRQNAFTRHMQSRGYVKLRPYQVPPTLKTRRLPLGAVAGN